MFLYFQAIGICVSWAVFFFQFVILYFDNDIENNRKPYQRKLNIKIPGFFSKELKLNFSFAYVGYAIMLISAFFGCVSQFRGYWLLIDIHFIPGKNSFFMYFIQILLLKYFYDISHLL